MTLMLVINIRQNIPSMHYKAKLMLLGHSSSPFSASVSQFFFLQQRQPPIRNIAPLPVMKYAILFNF